MDDDKIEVDVDYEGDDLDYASDTTSLKSNVLTHIYENGRRYHGWLQGRYPLPNDEDEQHRMDLQHHICLLALGGNLSAIPIEDPRRILDLGTGTGIWAIDIADKYPQARVIGIDLSPIQPTLVPPNLHFEIDDIEDTWEFASNTFSYIHIRQLTGFLKSWPHLYAQALRCLKPGGYLEIQDIQDGFRCDDGSVPEDHFLRKWNDLWVRGTVHEGFAMPGLAHVDGLAEAGFEEVGSRRIKIPCGSWPKDKAAKEIGVYYRQHLLEHAEGLTMGVFTRYLGWSRSQVEDWVAEALVHLRNPKLHAYANYYCIWGRKPEPGPDDNASVNTDGVGSIRREPRPKMETGPESSEGAYA